MTTPQRGGSLKPQPKVAAGGVAGAVTFLIVWLVGATGIDMSPEIASAVGVLITAGVAWLTPQAGGGAR